jgi:hypothetical protein
VVPEHASHGTANFASTATLTLNRKRDFFGFQRAQKFALGPGMPYAQNARIHPPYPR